MMALYIIEVPSKDVKSIGQDGIELHDLLNELTQNINELRKCLIKIAKGVPKLNLAQFGSISLIFCVRNLYAFYYIV